MGMDVRPRPTGGSSAPTERRRPRATVKPRGTSEPIQEEPIQSDPSREKQAPGFFGWAASGLLRWAFWTTALLFLPAVLLAGGIYLHVSVDLPRIESLNDYRPPAVTTVHADDGRKIAEFYRERRIVISLDRMPQMLINAFVAAEDSRFFEHEGVDLFSVARAFLKNLEAGEVVQGGSTITQQVTRSFFLSPERSYRRKLREAILSHRIEKALSKYDILHIYLNQIYLGNGAYGVEAAAENYFGKPTRKLNLAECATLAGLPPAPSRYSPIEDPKMARMRRLYVLNRMMAEGYIDPIQATRAYNRKLDLVPRTNFFKENAPYFTEHVRRYVVDRYGAEVLYRGGLTIRTTVNLEMQAAARREVEKGLLALEGRQGRSSPPVEGALLCVATGTGHVKAMIGGRDFDRSQFNRATQALRQPGSAFKPIIYAAALDKGYTPLTLLEDTPLIFRDPTGRISWEPENYDQRFHGPVRLRKALAKSRNIPVVRVLRDIGVDYAGDYARRLGITTRLGKNLSLALGTTGLSLLEMVTAFSVFANGGRLIHPVFITEILDRDGRPLEGLPVEPVQAISEESAYLMTSLLSSVVTNGTGWRARTLGRPVAGKTGTTNDFRDAWFLGYTPDYVAGTWVGHDQERPLGDQETGSRAASPIWVGFMERILADLPVQEFEPPDGIIFKPVDRGSGLLAREDDPNAVIECFRAGTEPTRHTPDPDFSVVAGKYPGPEEIITDPVDFFKSGI